MIGEKGKSVSVTYSGDRTHITVVFIIAADGSFTTPIFIVPSRWRKDLWSTHWPEAKYITTDNGYMTSEAFTAVAKHLCGEWKDGGSRTLVLDWHSSRDNLEAAAVFQAAGHRVITMQPHTTHYCQPVDVGVAGPFKTYLRKTVANMMSGGHPVEQKELVLAIRVAFDDATRERYDARENKMVSNIKSGFSRAGLYPWRGIDAVPKEAFEPALAIEAAMKAVDPEATLVPPKRVVDQLAVVKDVFGEVKLGVDIPALLSKTYARAKGPELLTGSDWLARKLARVDEKEVARKDKVARKEAANERKAANRAKKAEALLAKATRRAERDARAAAAAADAVEPAAVATGRKRRRNDDGGGAAGLDGDEAPEAVAAPPWSKPCEHILVDKAGTKVTNVRFTYRAGKRARIVTPFYDAKVRAEVLTAQREKLLAGIASLHSTA